MHGLHVGVEVMAGNDCRAAASGHVGRWVHFTINIFACNMRDEHFQACRSLKLSRCT